MVAAIGDAGRELAGVDVELCSGRCWSSKAEPPRNSSSPGPWLAEFVPDRLVDSDLIKRRAVSSGGIIAIADVGIGYNSACVLFLLLGMR